MRRNVCWLILATLVLTALSASGGESRLPQAPFFNGSTLDGWEGLIEDYWSVKDGAIVGSAPQGLKFNTFLCSKAKYRDFELKFQVRLTGANPNSGVQVRSEIMDAKTFAVRGPQCDMGQIYWGSLYGEHFGGMMKQAPKEVVEKVLKADKFNDYYIKVVGKHVTIKLNGAVTVDDDFPKLPEEGIIAWQLHAGGAMEAVFRNIQFTDLNQPVVLGTRPIEASPAVMEEPGRRPLFPRLRRMFRR